MRPSAIALATLALAASNSSAGFVIKQVILGNVVLPASRSSAESTRGAEMDGDPSSGEAILGWQDTSGGGLHHVGVVHLASGLIEEVALPDPAYALGYGGIWLGNQTPLLPDYADSDGDGLLEVLVPIIQNANPPIPKTLVIGWVVGAGVNVPPGSTTIPTELRTVPNPTDAESRLDFNMPAAGRVSVRLFDVSGRMVRELLEADLPAGGVSLAWDGRDDRGELVPAGVFFSRIELPGGTLAGRIVQR